MNYMKYFEKNFQNDVAHASWMILIVIENLEGDNKC